MARDVLAVPASGCAVERQFSVSGRMAIWQRNRLSPRIISDSMIYKSTLAKTRRPLREIMEVDDIDIPCVDEVEGTIPKEWTDNWWLKNVGKSVVSGGIVDLSRLDDVAEEEEMEAEDLYGSFE